MTMDDPSAAEMQARIEGLTQAMASIVATLIMQGAADENDIMRALGQCETDLLRMSRPTFGSAQASHLREEIRQRLAPPRDPFAD